MTDLVVKDNSLIDASYSLDLIEQRIVLLAIVIARETQQGVDAVTPLEVCAKSYCERFDVDRSTAYSILQKSTKTLFQKQFSYWDIDPKRGKRRKNYSRWVSKISYIESSGTVQLVFAPDIIPLIIRLEEKFTSYTIEQISKLTSTYAIRLYELLIRWKSTGKLNITLTDLRERLGLDENQYPRIDNFKSRVLSIAVSQINEHTDIKVSFMQQKKGRIVSGFIFSFKLKSLKANVNLKDASKKQVGNIEMKQGIKKIPLIWNTPENSLFKLLHDINHNLTKEAIEEKAKINNTDIISILNILYIKWKKNQQVDLHDLLNKLTLP